MRLTIFSRLVIGFIIIFLLQLSVSIYVTIRLTLFEEVPNAILDIDNKIIDYEKKLSDILLSQVRYEKKFIITRDTTLYDRFIEHKNEFTQYFMELQSTVNTSRAENLLRAIEQTYNQYQSLIYDEKKYVTSANDYNQEEYQQKKEDAVNLIIEKLQEIRSLSEKTTDKRIKKLGTEVSKIRNAFFVITLLFFIIGIGISILVTRGIVKPLGAVKHKTQKIAEGDFTEDLSLQYLSPPEIKELVTTINWMCYNLKQIDKIKADFFSSMSHELRTPLTSIKEGINLLLEKTGKDAEYKKQRLLTIMAEESNRLIELINTFLDLSKMEAGMVRYSFFPEDITPLIYQAINGIELLAAAKNITIEAQIDNGLPVVRMDSERILQVLRNIVGNAVKFTPFGGHVKVIALALKHGVGVSVADTGEGIAADDLKRIFDKFHQGSNVGDNNIGTGLGLSIVKHIIDAHGGKVWAESRFGIGSTFFFVLSA
jgi:two-component system sensor histidine kinase GlrK